MNRNKCLTQIKRINTRNAQKSQVYGKEKFVYRFFFDKRVSTLVPPQQVGGSGLWVLNGSKGTSVFNFRHSEESFAKVTDSWDDGEKIVKFIGVSKVQTIYFFNLERML